MFVKTISCILRNSRAELIFHRTFCSAPDAVPQLKELSYSSTRLLKVAIIGTPNAGKSTFINNLMDRKVCATSSKVHTTRGKAMAVFTVADAQIVFMDTPGLVNDKEKRKFNLERSFLKDSQSVLHQADIVGVIHDVSNIWTRERLDIKIIKLLSTNLNIPSFLVMNKIDIIKSKRKLLDLTRQLTENCLNGKPMPGTSKIKKENNHETKGWPNFQAIFMVSALTGDGMSEINNYLINQAKPGKWMFPDQVWTDQNAEQIIIKAVQAKLLDFLPQEIPYNLKPELEYFDINNDGVVRTAVTIMCPTERIAKLVAGCSDGKLRQITESLQSDLQNTFQNHVRLQLALKSPKTM